MSIHFDAELDALKEKLLSMSSHAEQALERALDATFRRDDALANKVREEDPVLDQFEIDMDDASIRLLAKAPLASDLRLITVAMKISHDLERVGDEATTIARQTLQLNKEAPLQPLPDVSRMVELTLSMLKDALDAFVHRNPDKARSVIPRDKEVDALNKQLNRDLVGVMVHDPGTITRCLSWMRIVKSIERIADHATNVAEEIVYLHEGRDIRHADDHKK